MKGLVYSPQFPRGAWWFYGMALAVIAIFALLGVLSLNGGASLLAWVFLAGAALLLWANLLRVLRGFGVVPLVKGKATADGYRLKSTYPVTMTAMDMSSKDGSRAFAKGSIVTIVERINRLGDDFYLGPTLYIYEVLCSTGNFRFFSESRLRSHDFDDLARTLADQDIALVLLIETGPEAGHLPVHRVTPEAPCSRWVALPRRTGVISAAARDGADILAVRAAAATRSSDSVAIKARDHRPCVMTVAFVPPADPSVWHVIGQGSVGRYGDTIMLWSETGGVQCHVDVPGGFTTFTVAATVAPDAHYFHVHLEGHQ